LNIAVLGAGVVGVTTAYYLAAAGHDVTVIDRAPGVATQCSYANGAQLSYSYTDSMASPSFLSRLPGLVAGMDRSIRFRPPADTDVVRWGLAFLSQCTRGNASANTLANLKLAKRSARLLRELRNDLSSDFHYREAGKLILLRTRRELDDARRASDIKAELGIRADLVSMEEASEIEPAIAHMQGPYAGGVYSPGDDLGDAAEFTRLLAARLQAERRASFHFDTEATGLIRDADSVRGCQTNRGDVEADAVVVCLGAWSPRLLQSAGIRTLIQPARGYSVTLPPGPQPPRASVTDFGRRFVVTRLGDNVRIAGFADFVGFSSRHDRERIEQLMSTAHEAAPQTAEFSHRQIHAWAGSRPMTPDGRPLVGRTCVRGLFLNTGHGSLGWTLACATAEQVASEVTAVASGSPLPRRRHRSAAPSPAETS
jgi:D-amino-acid dehydrogenase